MAKFATHMSDPRGDPQTSPQRPDPRECLVWFLKKAQVHVDRRVVGRSAGRHVDHPCGWQILPWPAREVTAWVLTTAPRLALTTHTPLIKGVHLHPLIEGAGPKNTL